MEHSEEIDLDEQEEEALDVAWASLAEGESESCPDCQKEKFVHHELPPSRFKGRKFVPPKEKT